MNMSNVDDFKAQANGQLRNIVFLASDDVSYRAGQVLFTQSSLT